MKQLKLYNSYNNLKYLKKPIEFIVIKKVTFLTSRNVTLNILTFLQIYSTIQTYYLILLISNVTIVLYTHYRNIPVWVNILIYWVSVFELMNTSLSK